MRVRRVCSTRTPKQPASRTCVVQLLKLGLSLSHFGIFSPLWASGSSHSAKGSLCSNPIATQEGCLGGPEHSASGVLRHLACSTAGSSPSSALLARSCFDVSFTRRVSLSSELRRRGCARDDYTTSQPILTGHDCQSHVGIEPRSLDARHSDIATIARQQGTFGAS